MDEKKETIPVEPISNVLQKGEDIANRLKTENDRAEKLLAQNQELAARQMLGGHTDAGVQPPKPVEETPKEYAKRIASGKV